MNRTGVSKRWPTQAEVESREYFECEYPVAPIEQSMRDDAWVVDSVKYADYLDCLPNPLKPWMVNDINVPSNGLYFLSRYSLLKASGVVGKWICSTKNWLNSYLVGVGNSYYWNDRFERLFNRKKLSLMSFGTEASALGVIAMLGLRETLIKQAYMTLAAAKRGFMAESYSHHQRRAQLFMLRLTMDWLGHTSLDWPAYAHDEPIYEELVAMWRAPDPQALVPALLRACDRHTFQTGRETERRRLDFQHEFCLDRVPVEILLLFRLREWEGLSNPVLDHPLMEAPFDRLIEPQTLPPLENLHERVLRRARSDWNDYDQVLSIEAMRAHALGPSVAAGA